MNRKLTIAPTIPGNISPSFLPIAFKPLPTPLPNLVRPLERLETITPMTTPTALTTAKTVKPYFLKMAFTRSRMAVFLYLDSFRLSRSAYLILIDYLLSNFQFLTLESKRSLLCSTFLLESPFLFLSSSLYRFNSLKSFSTSVLALV